MPKIEAVVFDVDGTLIDSREFIFNAYEHTLALNGIHDVSRDQLAIRMGKPMDVIYRDVAPEANVIKLLEAHSQHHNEHDHLLSSYPGAADTLDTLSRSGLRLGVFTGHNEVTIDRLERFGILEPFGSVVVNTRYKEHKPHPEGLLLCMQELEVSPEATLYVGDGVVDMEAARRAGVMAVGITHGFCTAEQLQEAGADYLIHSLSELPPLVDNLQTALQQR